MTQKELGQRILGLRKKKGLSQQDLSDAVKISRSSIAQIELGNRGIDTLELCLLGQILHFSLDELVAEEYDAAVVAELQQQVQVQRKEQKKAAPAVQTDKLRNILLYMFEHCAGKPNVGESVLHKLLYFSDRNYYELYEEQLTGVRYRKLQQGPVPQRLEAVIEKMIAGKQIQRFKTDHQGVPQTRYIPLVKADLRQLRASEKDVIDKVIAQMSDWPVSALTLYVQKDLPIHRTREGDLIDYDLVPEWAQRK